LPERIDYRFDEFVLDVPGRRFDVDIAESIIDGRIELTIDGASHVTLTVEDPHGNLLESDVLTEWAWGHPDNVSDEASWVRRGRDVDAMVGGKPFRLVKVAKNGTRLDLVFEDRIVALLRRHRGARKASRDKVTRAQFVDLLAREVKAHGGVPTVIPERDEKQPIEKPKPTTRSQRRARGNKGIAWDDELTVKGSRATSEQLRNMQRVLDVADALNAPPKAALALVAACIVESTFRNLTYGDRDSIGILQVRVGQHGRAVAASIERSVEKFLKVGFTGRGGAIDLARKHPSWTPGQIAQAVQGSAYPERYDQYLREARAIVRAYGGVGGRSGAWRWTEKREKRYFFTRGKDENSWDAIGRLAQEVGWRRFVRRGHLWYASDNFLFSQEPQLIVREGTGGVEFVDFDLDMEARIPIAECRVSLRQAAMWTALPGMVVVVRGQGPASGRWLVTSVSGSLFDEQREVTLQKPVPKKPEPAPEVRSVSRRAGGGSGTLSSTDPVDYVWAEAKRISDRRLPYVYGGGHSKAGTPSGSPRAGFDCSGYVVACLAAAGLGFRKGGPAADSGTLARSWGRPGRGRRMTVWANAQHAWIEFHDRRQRADTSPAGDGGPSGPRLRPMNRSRDGFTPRHWPGT